MDYQKLLLLIEKSENHSATPAEMAELDEFYDSFEARDAYTSQLDHSEAYGALLLSEIKVRILSETAPKKFRLFPIRYATAGIAASILFVIGLAAYFYISPFTKDTESIPIARRIGPGKNIAILTSADGRTVSLDDKRSAVMFNGDQLTYDDGSVIPLAGKENEGNAVQNVLTTPKGGTYQVVLPDGSRVWLNAGTSLKFPGKFPAVGNREVELAGEAYFEVVSNKKKPFIVRSFGQQVEVLGTHFNVNSYADEPRTLTTLISGSVKVFSSYGSAVIRPGEQSSFIGERQALQVTQVDTTAAVAWKNGLFQFHRAPITEIMKQLSRWYDIEVHYQGEVPKKVFTGKIYRNLNLSESLEILSYFNVNFSLRGRQLTIIN